MDMNIKELFSKNLNVKAMKPFNKWQLLSLFTAGVFFGGAIDHAIYAISNSETSHYGFRIGIRGNWLMSLLDLTITAFLLWLAVKKTNIKHANV
jgi:hypothetical protein